MTHKKHQVQAILLGMLIAAGQAESAYSAPVQADPKSIEDVRLDLDLQKAVTTPGRPLTVFHFMSRERMDVSPTPGPINMEDPGIKNHFKDWTAYYSDLGKNNSGSNVKGLYAAMDPLATRSYGKNDWLLYQIEFPNDYKILDVSDARNRPIPEATQRSLEKFGCYETDFQQLFWHNYSKACRKAAVAALKALGIGAIKYSYGGTPIKDCMPKEMAAYIIVSSDGIRPDNVKIFSPETPAQGPLAKDRAVLQQLYREYGSKLFPDKPGETIDYMDVYKNMGGGLVGTPPVQASPSPEPGAVPDRDLTIWKGLHLLGCGNLNPFLELGQPRPLPPVDFKGDGVCEPTGRSGPVPPAIRKLSRELYSALPDLEGA